MKDSIISTEKISATGVYDLTNEEYHGDCCDGLSLSASSVKQIITDPADFWNDCPRNPENQKKEEKPNPNFSVGTAAHTMVLEPELLAETVSVIPSDMLASNGALSTKAAKAFLAEQTELGRAVVRPDEWEVVCNMADAITSHDVASRALMDGKVEQSLIVKDETTGIFVKSRPDFHPNKSGRLIVDLKTTVLGNIEAWEKSAATDLRYDIQAALMMWALRETTGIEAVGVMYVVACKLPPHRVAVRTIRPATEVGRALLDNGWLDFEKAMRIAAECNEAGVWPSPWDSVSDISPPEWHMRRVEKRLDEGAYVSPFAQESAI